MNLRIFGILFYSCQRGRGRDRAGQGPGQLVGGCKAAKGQAHSTSCCDFDGLFQMSVRGRERGRV